LASLVIVTDEVLRVRSLTVREASLDHNRNEKKGTYDKIDEA